MPVFAHRNALLKLTTALERGEIAVGDAAEATALEEYRSAFLAKGFLLSALLGTAAFVKTDPFWILHKPRQWTKLGQLSAVRVPACVRACVRVKERAYLSHFRS